MQGNRGPQVCRKIPLAAKPLPDFGVIEAEDFVLGLDGEDVLGGGGVAPVGVRHDGIM